VLNGKPIGALNFSLKVAAPCNLNCSYCYVYNKADSTWRDRPAIMPDPVFTATLDRIREHCLLSGQETVEITYHGGEPCLVGTERFARWCQEARVKLSDITKVRFVIQTNGTLVTPEWLEVFRAYSVSVGVSLDGPAHINDVYRVDKKGRGSYARVERGIRALLDADLDVGVLAVIQLGVDGLSVHQHLTQMGFKTISYLLPHFSHDNIAEAKAAFGPTPCADYLLPILNFWWTHGTIDQEIVIFWQMSRVVLGGCSLIDLFGNRLLSFVFVETDGSIAGLDTLKVAAHGLADTGLNVQSHRFLDIRGLSDLHRQAIFDGVPTPSDCKDCAELITCGGGHLADRYSSARGLNNRSVWCDDLLALFGRVRELLGVNPMETLLRREVLREAREGPYEEVSG
jgi:uncharacterized protein